MTMRQRRNPSLISNPTIAVPVCQEREHATHRIVPSPKLAPEVALVRQIERRRQPVVRLLERLDAEPMDVLHRLELARRARAKRGALHACVPELLDDVREDILDGAERCPRELQRPLDLEAMLRRKLGEHDHRARLRRRRQRSHHQHHQNLPNTERRGSVQR